jgi:hypothetical protein
MADEPKKVGRKPKADKNVAFTISASPKDLARFKALAELYEMSYSDFFRHIFEDHIKYVKMNAKGDD